MGKVKELLLERGLDIDLLRSEKKYSLNWSKLDEVVEFTKDKLIELNRVGVLYDVDVDGLVSGKIIEEYLRKLGVIVYRKMNTQKRHGLTKEVVDWAVEKEIELLYVVDAGSNDIEYQEELSNKGIAVIVLDHHDIAKRKEIDNVFVVNCQDVEDLPALSGAGVCYRYVEKLDHEVNGSGVTQYEPWVGLTVLSDHCSMFDSENRYYVEKLYELYDKIDLFRAFTFWGSKRNLFLFGVIPFLNVCIRLNEVDLAMDIILSNNYTTIKKLIDGNRERLLDKQKYLTAKLKSESKKITGESVVLVRIANENRDYVGLTGLIANQIMDETKKSVIVIYEDDESGLFKGSFRGRDSINNTVLEEVGWVVRGHAQAAGVELDKDKGNEVLKKTKEIVSVGVRPHYDFELNDHDIVRNLELLREIARFNEMASGDIETLKFKLNKSKDPFREKRGKRFDYNFLSFVVRDFSDIRKADDIWVIEPLLDKDDIVLLRK